MPVPSICETTCFYYQTWDNYSVYEHDFEPAWLWGNSNRAFSLPRLWNGRHVSTQNAAKLELSVCKKCLTHFVKTCLPGFYMSLTLTWNLKYFSSDNSLDAGKGTSASTKTRIKIFPFLVLALMLATVCTVTNENEIPFRHNTSTKIFSTRGYVWPVKSLDPDYLGPKQFGMFRWFSLCVCLRQFSFSLAWLHITDETCFYNYLRIKMLSTPIKW